MCTCYCYFLESTCTDCWVVEREDFGEGDTIWGCVDLVYVNMMGLYYFVFFWVFLGDDFSILFSIFKHKKQC
jgi:hypothetical protein